MSECTHDCASCGESCGERSQPQDFRKPCNPLSKIGKVIAVASGKGGVGKSLVTSSLAAAMAARGKKVGVLDADITGPSIPKAFGIHEHALGDDFGIYPQRSKGGIEVMSLNLLTENETDPIIWRGPVIAGTVTQFWTDVVWGDLDYLFVLVSMIVTKAVKMCQMMKIPVLGLVENYSYFRCPNCGTDHAIFGQSNLSELAGELAVPILARLPIDPAVAAACDAGTIETLSPNYLSEVAEKLDG